MALTAVTLVGTDAALVHAWRNEFRPHSSVAIRHETIFAVEANALVSPANSFGVMDGGLDGKLRDFFGVGVERSVRQRIARDYHGELPVGLAVSVETGHPQYRYLICAPTMRYPADVSRTVNAYLAMKAILNEATRHPADLHVAVPGLCSLTGGMSARQVARQMRIAYERVVVGLYQYSHWREEREFESFIRGDAHVAPEDLEAVPLHRR